MGNANRLAGLNISPPNDAVQGKVRALAGNELWRIAARF
jgi:hypothetical protein